jgi:hypothetical protein
MMSRICVQRRVCCCTKPRNDPKFCSAVRKPLHLHNHHVLLRARCSVFSVSLSTRIIFWEKSWGTIRSVSYLEHMVPVLRGWLQNEELVTGQPHYIVQDQAPSHFPRANREQMAAWGTRSMNHPATSPDLNLAENPIGPLKYNIMNRRDRCLRGGLLTGVRLIDILLTSVRLTSVLL